MKPVRLLLPALVAGLSLPPCSTAESRPPDAGSALDRTGVVEALGRMPLRFEKNDGQTDPQVRFLSRGPGYGLFLTPAEVVLSLQGSRESSPGRPFHSEDERAGSRSAGSAASSA
jgi:hypothetical protein